MAFRRTTAWMQEVGRLRRHKAENGYAFKTAPRSRGVYLEQNLYTKGQQALRIDEFIRLYSLDANEDLDFALPELKQAMRTEELSNSGE